MEFEKKLKDDASDFVTFMYQKGYRGKFMMDKKVPTSPFMRDNLSHCLDKFLQKYVASEKKDNLLQLETYAWYVSELDNVHCQFKVQYDEVKGFLIKEVAIQDAKSKEKKVYPSMDNHQVPGSQAAIGLFPKPKPWDYLRKGKFRP
jgi:hypothetical protein